MQEIPEYIFKIATSKQWKEAEDTGSFQGAPIDLQDGYIHFSTAEQVRETAAKHFRGQKNLKLVKVATAQLGDALKWEVSRGGALFPHLYDSLSKDHAISIVDIAEDENGGHIFAEVL